MTITGNGDTDLHIIAVLENAEGLSRHPYRDTVGKLTIGYGRNLDDVGISETEAEFLLRNDISRAKSGVAEKFEWATMLDPVRYAVMVELVFNMGAGKLAAFDETVPAIQRGQYSLAADLLSRTKWAKDVKKRRSDRVCGMLRTGEWPIILTS